MEKITKRIAELKAKLPDIEQKLAALSLDEANKDLARKKALNAWSECYTQYDEAKTEIRNLENLLKAE